MNRYPKQLLTSKTFYVAILGIAGAAVAFGFGEIGWKEFVLTALGLLQTINLKSGQITGQITGEIGRAHV